MMNERCAKDLDLPNSEYDFVLFTLEVELYSMYDDARFEIGAEMTRCRSDLNSFWKGETEYTCVVHYWIRIRVVSPRLPVRPGSIRHGSFRPGKWVDSPPINCYYIIIDEVFFDNFWEIIYLLVVCKKNNNSFILVYFKYLFISWTYKKNNNSFILVYFCQRSQVKLFLQNLQKQHARTVKRLCFFLYQRKSAWND
jgi:hypothetical protein